MGLFVGAGMCAVGAVGSEELGARCRGGGVGKDPSARSWCAVIKCPNVLNKLIDMISGPTSTKYCAVYIVLDWYPISTLVMMPLLLCYSCHST